MQLPIRSRFFALATVAGIAALACSSIALAEDVSVKIRSTALRSQPKAWAATLAVLSYGDTLKLTGADGSWMKVKSKGGTEGFVHSSALTTKKVVLASAKSPSAQVDRADIVMAGKGFSKEIERQFASANGSLNYASVNEVERFRVSSGELSAFMKSGKLKG
ncbi:MAG: SH3 domain-containing protein [Oligoflexia bacterium]|nr:SH3 domain-containing protein [Oligoflexia bacterium]